MSLSQVFLLFVGIEMRDSVLHYGFEALHVNIDRECWIASKQMTKTFLHSTSHKPCSSNGGKLPSQKIFFKIIDDLAILWTICLVWPSNIHLSIHLCLCMLAFWTSWPLTCWNKGCCPPLAFVLAWYGLIGGVLSRLDCHNVILRIRAMHEANIALLDILVDNSVIIPSI